VTLDPAERRRLLDAGAADFDARRFFDAHERWEEVWDEADDPERRWLQGMIQVATGLHKLAAGRPDVCHKLLDKAIAKLDGAPAAWEGFALERLGRDAAALRAAIERGERPDPGVVPLGRV
jgi:predicted metal-dependent hydrolase